MTVLLLLLLPMMLTMLFLTLMALYVMIPRPYLLLVVLHE
jgi:hypothetical protein